MTIRFWEVINVVLAVLFIFGAARRDTKAILFFLLAYGSLHFFYAAIPMLTGMPVGDIVKIHHDGSGVLAQISSVAILATAVLVLIFKSISYPNKDTTLLSVFTVVLIAIGMGYLVNLRLDDWMQFRDVVVTGLMLVLMVLLSQNQNRLEWQADRIKVYVVVLTLAVMLCVAFYEMYSLRAWACFADSSGEIIYRASSLLFNPNLYGIWCAVMALGFSYLLHLNIGPRALILLAMVMAFAGIYLSGSRSAGFSLLLLLIGIALSINAQDGWRRWTPAILMLVVFLIMEVGSGWLGHAFPQNYASWHAIGLLGERFSSFPMQLGSYLLSHLHFPGFPGLPGLPTFAVPAEVTISIDGRFEEGMRDSGWLVLYDDTGWFGIIAVLLWLCALFGLWGARTYLRKRNVPSVYALAILIFTVVIGVVMRFQAFPTGLFVALILAPCIAYWRTDIAGNREGAR
jgi:hypothetical protein